MDQEVVIHGSLKGIILNLRRNVSSYLVAIAICITVMLPYGSHVSAAMFNPTGVILSGTNDILLSIKRYEHSCGNPKINLVQPRRDGYGFDLFAEKNWSLKSDQFSQFLGFQNTSAVTYTPFIESRRLYRSLQSHKPICTKVQNIVESSSFDYSDRPCTISWLSSVGICQVLQKYSHVMWLGDSLTRHMTSAFHVILTQNLRYGGIPDRPVTDKQILKECNCDGAFSEFVKCRTNMEKLYPSYAFQQDGFCSYNATSTEGLSFIGSTDPGGSHRSSAQQLKQHVQVTNA